MEVMEVVLLALVAIATAWGGCKAAKWEGRQFLLYGRALTFPRYALKLTRPRRMAVKNCPATPA